jgi:hypothetical protein
VDHTCAGWQAQITYSGKNHYLGKFHTDAEAARAYDHAARQHYGVNAICNFMLDEDEQ